MKDIPAYFTYSFLHLPILIVLDCRQDKKMLDVISSAGPLTRLVALVAIVGVLGALTGGWVEQQIHYLWPRLVRLQ